MKVHVPKVDTGDDCDFMCGTHAFSATIGTRDLCAPCVNRTLEVVDLLAEAYDELRALAPQNKRAKALMRRIDKVLGKRPLVDYSTGPDAAPGDGETP